MAKYRLKKGTSFKFNQDSSLELDTLEDFFTLSERKYINTYGHEFYQIMEFTLSNEEGTYLYLAKLSTVHYWIYIGNSAGTSISIGGVDVGGDRRIYDNGDYLDDIVIGKDTSFTPEQYSWLIRNTNLQETDFEEVQAVVGWLAVRKIVESTIETDKELYFTFTVQIQNISDRTPSRGETFTLKHGEVKAFPLWEGDTVYHVRETLKDGFLPNYPRGEVLGIISETNRTINLIFTNTSTYDPPPPTETTDTSVSGTGDEPTRTNEITPDNVAVFRNFAMGHNSDIRDIGGVFNIPDHNFNASKGNADKFISINLTDGFCFAYGYCAYHPATQIDFLIPVVEQYQLIYAELDRSAIPNSVQIKTKINYGSRVLYNTFRQDVLSTIKTGKFQVPLWLVKLTNTGEVEFKSIRVLRDCISNVVYAHYTKRISGTIAPDAEVGIAFNDDMKPLDTNDNTVASTRWAKARIEEEINK